MLPAAGATPGDEAGIDADIAAARVRGGNGRGASAAGAGRGWNAQRDLRGIQEKLIDAISRGREKAASQTVRL